VIHQGQKSFRSQVAYVNLVAVLIISALIIVVLNSKGGAAVFAVLGIIWTAVTLRSGIDVTDEGLTVRGLLRTTKLSWADTDGFVVLGLAGAGRPVLRTSVDYLAPSQGGAAQAVGGLSLEAISDEALAAPMPLFSVVAAVTRDGQRLRVHGTASTPLDPEFPAHAAAELNRRLNQHSPAATAIAG
jgi:hypothetical protein